MLPCLHLLLKTQNLSRQVCKICTSTLVDSLCNYYELLISIENTTITNWIQIIDRSNVTKSHPVVEQLVGEFEYELSTSIEAVKLCGGSLAKALEYLSEIEGEDPSAAQEVLQAVAEERYSQ